MTTELLADLSISHSGYDLIRPSRKEVFEFDQDMILTIAALLLGASDFEQSMEERPESPPPAMLNTINDVLKEIILSRQKAYKTTIAEDYDLLNDAALQPRRRMAIEVRLGEKEILALAADHFDKKTPGQDQEAGDQENAKRRRYD